MAAQTNNTQKYPVRFGTARGVLLCLLFHFNGLGGAPGGVDFFLALGAVGTDTHIVGGLGPVR